jgi:Flp pilus assembly protein TadG
MGIRAFWNLFVRFTLRKQSQVVCIRCKLPRAGARVLEPKSNQGIRVRPVESRTSQRFEIVIMFRFVLSEQFRRRLHAVARRFAREARGNFTILFAFTAPILILFVGMGVDYLTALSDKSRMDTAADAAAITAVNSAVAYYKLNPKNETGSSLKNDAIAAGTAQALSVFKVNMGATQVFATAQLNSPVTPTIDICDAATPACGPLTFNSVVTWSGKVAAHFGPLVSIQNVGIGGSSGATAGLNPYIDFYVLVDTSGSMGIPTSTTDQQTLIANNPDNPTEAAAGYTGGCQFACHFSGYQGFTYAQSNNIQLKLNSVASAIQALISNATTTQAAVSQTNEFRIGVYPFIVHAVQAVSILNSFSPFAAAQAFVNPAQPSPPGTLPEYLDDGGVAHPTMGSGGTHFENLAGDMSAFLQTPGTGLSQTSTLPFIILITDGVDNSQTYSPFTGSYPQTPNIDMCTNAKNNGYTVAVILIPYVQIVDPEPIWNNEDGVVNNLISTNAISPVMQSCASSGYFFSAATSQDITNAMVTIFNEAVSASRITQ